MLFRTLPFAVIVLLSSCTHALYEDQVFKFDWRKQYIGESSELRPPLPLLLATLIPSHYLQSTLIDKNKYGVKMFPFFSS